MADTDKDWVLVRYTVDAVYPAEAVPNEYRRDAIARELTENLHSSVSDEDDQINMKVEKLVRQHIHDNTESPCQDCNLDVYDDRNGNSVVADSAAMA